MLAAVLAHERLEVVGVGVVFVVAVAIGYALGWSGRRRREADRRGGSIWDVNRP